MNFDAVVTATPIRTRRRESEALRIVKVALSAFLERGLDHVTAEEIADAAGISRRTFFRYFPSKDDVLAMVHRRSMDRVMAAWRDRPVNEPFLISMLNASRAISEMEIEPDERILNDLSTRLLLLHPETWERIIRQIGRDVEIEMESIIAARQTRLGKDPATAAPLAAITWSVGCAVFRQWLENGAKGGLSGRLEKAYLDIRDALD